MTEVDWIWQIILPLFFLTVLAVMFAVVIRGRGPKGFGPKVYLPRHLTPQQEKQIAWWLYQGSSAQAARAYAEFTGAGPEEAAYAIDHWSER